MIVIEAVVIIVAVVVVVEQVMLIEKKILKSVKEGNKYRERSLLLYIYIAHALRDVYHSMDVGMNEIS